MKVDGAKIRRLREEMHLTRAEFCDGLKLHTDTLFKIETGETKAMTTPKIEEVARGFTNHGRPTTWRDIIVDESTTPSTPLAV